MARAKLYASTICYLQKDEKVLMLRFNRKYQGIYCAPGGKVEPGETPTECLLREFKEETGLRLINPKLKGFAYWRQGDESGIVYVYFSTKAKGVMRESPEGVLEWVNGKEIMKVKQFGMNKIFSGYVHGNMCELFEGKFYLDANNEVLDFKISWI